MSHFKQFESDTRAEDGRNLGDQWVDWDGANDAPIKEDSGLFLILSGFVLIFASVLLAIFLYLITPRLAMWNPHVPVAAWMISTMLFAASVLWFVQLIITAKIRRRIIFSPQFIKPLFNMIFSGAFRIGQMFGVSRDRVGHSFVRVCNNLARAKKPNYKDERLLLLLPRCLAKDELRQINELKDFYPIMIHIVSGGELARKKVKETRPTAVIGVACERDLVSGIRDVGTRFSVIGIPNQRPLGPCKETHIDMQELVSAIEFFVGPPKTLPQA